MDREGEREREGGGEEATETHRIALQLGREIALSSVRRPFRRGQLDSGRSWNSFATKWRAKEEDLWHFAFFFFILFDLGRRGPISNRDFRGFREDYSVKVITFDRSLSRGGLILPIFFFFIETHVERKKEIVWIYFRKSTIDLVLVWWLERIERRIGIE